ncbi:MAG: GntR family transcriptional regulator [Phycisphaerales bacterium]|jgi:GntR family transcriptional regulator
MQLKIDNASDRPVYQQIIDQVKRDIALGRLSPQEKLPTVRELAAALAINPNTIAKAYRQLEREGIITTRPGSGAFVAELSTDLNMSVRKRIVNAELERAVIEAIHMKIDKRTFIQWFNTVVEKFRFPAEKG